MELESLNRSQFATGFQKHRDPRFPPYAFTEHGAIQASNVLSSRNAVEMGIYVIRAFLKLRELLASNHELARRFERNPEQFAGEYRIVEVSVGDDGKAVKDLALPGRE